MTDLSRAISESLSALEKLGEPLNLSNIDYKTMIGEVIRQKDKRKELPSNALEDVNKRRAMKIMSSLITYYHSQGSPLSTYVCCQMIEMTMQHGHCEYSVLGFAAYAAALVSILEDIDEGNAWGRTALKLMERYSFQPPSIAALYGIVFVWKGK